MDTLTSGFDFDRAAGWYDFLSTLVFGSAIRDLERSLIPHMAERTSLCWIGGGTGALLPEILKTCPSLKIEFVELSSNMRRKAARRIDAHHQDSLRFWPSMEDLSDTGELCDTLFLSCVMDVYTEKQLAPLLCNWTRQRPVILAVDFVVPASGPGRWLAKAMIPLMYRFFHLMIGLPVIPLPDWEATLCRCGYEKQFSKKAWLGMLTASVWVPSGV